MIKKPKRRWSDTSAAKIIENTQNEFNELKQQFDQKFGEKANTRQNYLKSKNKSKYVLFSRLSLVFHKRMGKYYSKNAIN